MVPIDFSTKNYLVIDDFADMRSAIRSILRSLGATQVDQARDGTEAISLMRRRRFDVILCDYNLGKGKDGQQVLEEARYHSLIGIDAIFIMITAENSREMVMGAVEYVPDNYLSKPFTKDVLKGRLVKLFERKADLAPINKSMKSKDYNAAIAQLDQLLAGKPRNRSDLLKLKAEICISGNRHDEALAIYEEILSEREVNWAHFGKGRVLFYRKQYEAARAVFCHLLETDPNFVSAYDWLAKTQVAEKAFDAAQKTLGKARELSPRSVERQQRFAELALSNGDAKAAEGAYDRAVTLARHSVRNHPSLYSGLANSKISANKPDEAMKVVRDLNKAFSDSPEADFYSASVTAAVKQKQGDAEGAAEALEAAEQAISRLGDVLPPKLALEMVKTCSLLGEMQRATSYLHQTVVNNHDDQELLAEVVRVCEESGIEEQSDVMVRAIQQEVVKTNNAGVRLIKEGDYAGAIRMLHQAADEMPGNKTITLNAAKAYIIKMESMGPSPEEIQCVRRYVEKIETIAPDDWRLADVKARLKQLIMMA